MKNMTMTKAQVRAINSLLGEGGDEGITVKPYTVGQHSAPLLGAGPLHVVLAMDDSDVVVNADGSLATTYGDVKFPEVV